MKNKFRFLSILVVLALLLAPCTAGAYALAENAEGVPVDSTEDSDVAEETPDKTPEEDVLLRFNAEKNFSDLGSPFWKYYYINEDPDSVLTELSVHGGGPQGDYAYDGSWVMKYKYVVDSSDYISDEYHQYLGIWGGITMHPGGKADVVLSFIAPVDGVINIDATIKASNAGSDGVKLYTTVNSLDLENKIYPADSDYILHTSKGNTEYAVEGYEVKRGDEIFFRLNKNETLANDLTYFSPTVSYMSYVMPEDVAIVVGAESLTLPEGGIRLLEAEMNVNLGQSLEYVFVSSDENVVKVENNGLIYGIKEGMAVITVTEKGSGLSAQCSVTVEKEKSKKDEKSGCGSTAAGGIIAGTLIIGMAAFAKKRLERKK